MAFFKVNAVMGELFASSVMSRNSNVSVSEEQDKGTYLFVLTVHI